MLMLVVLVVGGGLGWICYRARVQREAVAAIEAAGGEVMFDWHFEDGFLSAGTLSWRKKVGGEPGWLRRHLGPGFFEKVIFVILDANPDDSVMRHISRLTDLQVLMNVDGRVTDAGLANVRGLSDLRWLTISAHSITNRGLANVGQLTRLEFLVVDLPLEDLDLTFLRHLSSLQELGFGVWDVPSPDLSPIADLTHLKSLELGLNVRDRDLVVLKGLKELVNLELNGVRNTGVGLTHLRTLYSLKDLRLYGATVTDLEPLRHLGHLETLCLNGTRVNDSGLAPVAGCTHLRNLYLQNTPITDAGLVHLTGLKRCGEILFHGTNVTPAGIAALKAKCPWMGMTISQ
ncbi:MAG TPA: hypothetical protein VGZ22_26530 [Isosphaeraceae bacterium]|jgi:hypothetical protein|nr:hypothetical protein [Isosphaeraceae bacterium]